MNTCRNCKKIIPEGDTIYFCTEDCHDIYTAQQVETRKLLDVQIDRLKKAIIGE